MGVESYLDRNDFDSKVSVLKWRGKDLLVNRRIVNGSLIQKSGVDVYVLGFCEHELAGDGRISYGVRIIPLKFQKNCRAFLRGVDFVYIDNVIRFAGDYRRYKKKRHKNLGGENL